MSALDRGGRWSATLTERDLLDAPVVLRPVRFGDAHVLRALRAANEAWLRKWEPSDPREQAGRPTPAEPAAGWSPFSAVRQSPAWPYLQVSRIRWDAARKAAVPWVVCYDGELVGQVTIWAIAWGSARLAQLGYWIDEGHAGRGITPTALALAVDHAFAVIGLHRLEAGIRPENSASRRVVEKLGFRDEGTRVRQVHIDGAWRDHVYYAVTAEDVPDGMLSRWRDSRAAARPQDQHYFANETLQEGCELGLARQAPVRQSRLKSGSPLEVPMSLMPSPDMHKNLIARIPRQTGRELAEWFTHLESGPAFMRREERANWLADEHGICDHYAAAIVHEYYVQRRLRLFDA